jgi:hypothetical protein
MSGNPIIDAFNAQFGAQIGNGEKVTLAEFNAFLASRKGNADYYKPVSGLR